MPAPPDGGAGPPVSSDLLRRHRNSRSPLLILGGTPPSRRQVAQAFHATSQLRLGAFVVVDCATEEARLHEALRHWLTRAAGAGPPNPLWPAERGTLYLESIDSLHEVAQQLLLTFIHRCSTFAPADEEWLGRLAAGGDEDPWDLVAQGRFLGGLADGLDKIRVELNPRRQGGVA